MLLAPPSFDAAPAEAPVFSAVAMNRRLFSAPSQRQAELRVILANSTDRGRRRQARLRPRASARDRQTKARHNFCRRLLPERD